MSDWKKPIYESLSTEGNPAGDILRELSDSEMEEHGKERWLPIL